MSGLKAAWAVLAAVIEYRVAERLSLSVFILATFVLSILETEQSIAALNDTKYHPFGLSAVSLDQYSRSAGVSTGVLWDNFV
jgi:hypothetical protein